MSFPAELFLSCLLVFRRVSCFIDVDGGSQSPCARFLYCAMIMAGGSSSCAYLLASGSAYNRGTRSPCRVLFL